MGGAVHTYVMIPGEELGSKAECTADWGLLSPIRTETRCVDLPYIMGDNDWSSFHAI